VTSIELFDECGELIAMFFGERKPGKPELPAWRELAHSLAGGTPPSSHRPQKEAA
jgi:putative hemin transport protein